MSEARRRASTLVTARVIALLSIGLVSGCAVPGTSTTAGAGEPAIVASSAAGPARLSSPSPSGSVPPTVGQFRSVRRYAGVAPPERLRIPEAGVDTSLTELGLTPEGWIEAPTDWDVAGWYAGGPRPGQQGPAVIVGHIDSRSGPAVFHRLPELRRGAVITVDRQDGSSVAFRVVGHRQLPKEHFPATEVYAPTLEASLVLITCGGVFDSVTGHYRDNIVVTAVPA